MITIIGALKGELQPFIFYFGLKEKKNIEKGSLYISNDSFHLLRTGLGGKSCQQTLSSYLKIYQPKLIINIGTAGIINPQITAGSVYYIEKIYKAEEDDALVLPFETKHHIASLLTADEPLTNTILKNKYFEKYEVDLVDMEAWYCAETAIRYQTPFISWKITSDYADENTKKDFQENYRQLTNKLAAELIPILLNIASPRLRR